MKLSDIMGHAGLAVFAEAALLLFLGVFAVVAWRVLCSGQREMEQHARIPVDGD
jgi:HAMP domain-containing protein